MGSRDPFRFRNLTSRADEVSGESVTVEEILSRVVSKFPDRKAAFDEVVARARKARNAG